MKSVAITLLFSLVLPLSVAAQCPMNHVGAGANGHGLQYDSTDPSKSYEGTPVVPGGACVSCYSWPAGYFRVSGAGAPTDWSAFVNATDHFQLSGPASGTALSFSARLRITGSTSLYTTGNAGLGDFSGGSNATVIGGGQSPSNLLVVLPLQHLPNDPFDLIVDLNVGTAYAYSPGDLAAYLEFVDVPQGYAIVSCQGYDVPVPTVPETWGRLRATYR